MDIRVKKLPDHCSYIYNTALLPHAILLPLIIIFASFPTNEFKPFCMLIKTNAGYIFEQLQCLLQYLTDEQYVSSPDIFSGASVGKHYRHIIEFFQCVAVSGATDTICYDNRARDVRIESSRQVATSLLAELKHELAEIDNQHKLTLIGNLAAKEETADVYIGTTLFREFHYAVEHAIHHMAIIKMGVSQSFPGVEMPADFGVAPSTLRCQQSVVSGNA